MNIREKIYNYFNKSPELKVLFVFDPSGMVRYEIEEIDEPWQEDYIYQIFGGDWFSTKYRLAHEWAERKVILVFGQNEPSNQDTCLRFPLMSILEANMVFHEEDAIAFMQQRGIPMQYRDFFEKHINELLRDKFDKVLAPSYRSGIFNFDTGYRGLLSVYLGSSKLMDWSEIIASLFIMCANDQEKTLAFFAKIEGKAGKNKTNDVKAFLDDKLKALSGKTYNINKEGCIRDVAEVFKYNLMTQTFAVDNADPYKELKIMNSVKLQETNSLFSAILSHSKVHEPFLLAFHKLAENIKEDKLVDVYGTDARYAFVSEELCRIIVNRLVGESLYANPSIVIERLRALAGKLGENKDRLSVLDYFQYVALFYEKKNSLETVKLNTPDFYIQSYMSSFYLLDMYYRQSIISYVEVEVDDKSELMEQVKHKLDIDYADITNEINLEWLRCVKEIGVGFETITSIERQPDFYQNHLKGAKNKVAVIVSDAFRYEMAVELLQQLTSKKHIATLTGAMAMLPTETKYCKPSMLPHEQMVCIGDDMLVDGKVRNKVENRTELLQSYEERGYCVNYKSLAAMTKQQVREVFKNQVVFVFHDTIDDRCHGCTAFGFASACKDAFADLVKLVGLIHDTANVSELYVTADHGFLYNDILFEEKDKQVIEEEYVDRTSRYYICKDDIEQKGIVKFPVASVSMMKGDYYVSVPAGTNRLAVPAGDYQFAHGGAALQELIIPIICSKYKRTNEKPKVSVALMEPTISVSSSRLKVHLVQGEAVSMSYQERNILCGIYVNDELVSPLKSIMLDSTDEEMGASRIYTVDLTVNHSATSKIMQFKVFDAKDTLNPLICKNVINNTLIEQDDF